MNKARTSPIRSERGPDQATRIKCAMFMTIPVHAANGKIKELEFLVDTGAEVNIIQKGLLAAENWKMASSKLNLYTASGTRFDGGDKISNLKLEFLSIPVGAEEGQHYSQVIEGEFYEGELSDVDGILSHSWLFENKLAVFPHRGCLLKEGENSHWLFGVDISETLEEWEGVSNFDREKFVNSKGKVQRVDEITDQELDNILTRFNWRTPPILTPEQQWQHLPTSKYIRRVAIFKDIKNWGIKPEEGGM